jgi:hypothetical protein
MTNPTPTNNANNTPKAARAMLALVVLAEQLPMPVTIRFSGEGCGEPGDSFMTLSFRSVAAGQAWSRHLGCRRTDTKVNRLDGRTYLEADFVEWHGWTVHLQASDDPNPGSELDTDTATHLAEIAGGER